MDAGIQSQGREAANFRQVLPQPLACHPWTLDSGFHAGMTDNNQRFGSK